MVDTDTLDLDTRYRSGLVQHARYGHIISWFMIQVRFSSICWIRIHYILIQDTGQVLFNMLDTDTLYLDTGYRSCFVQYAGYRNIRSWYKIQVSLTYPMPAPLVVPLVSVLTCRLNRPDTRFTKMVVWFSQDGGFFQINPYYYYYWIQIHWISLIYWIQIGQV